VCAIANIAPHFFGIVGRFVTSRFDFVAHQRAPAFASIGIEKIHERSADAGADEYSFLSHIVSFWKSRSDSASALVLIAAIALAGLDDGLRVLLSVLRERAFHVHFFIKLTLIIAPHVSFVFAGIYQFAFTCLAFCHTSSSKARVTLTNTLVFANDAGTR